MGIMVSYRVMVKLVIGGLASVFNDFDVFKILEKKTPEKLIMRSRVTTVTFTRIIILVFVFVRGKSTR